MPKNIALIDNLPLSSHQKYMLSEICSNFDEYKKRLEDTLLYLLANRYGHGKQKIAIETLGHNKNIFNMLIDFLRIRKKLKKVELGHLECKLPKIKKDSQLLPNDVFLYAYNYLFKVLDKTTYPLVSIYDKEHRDYYIKLMTDPLLVAYELIFSEYIASIVGNQEMNILVIGNEFFFFPVTLEYSLVHRFDVVFFSEEIPSFLKFWHPSFKERVFYINPEKLSLDKLSKKYNLAVGFLPFSFLGNAYIKELAKAIKDVLFGNLLIFQPEDIQPLLIPFGVFDEFIYYSRPYVNEIFSKYSSEAKNSNKRKKIRKSKDILFFSFNV
ncbi:MAG: hypothetical protein ACP6IS_10800 [Candidatus Asgardarchaeia archaeon]